MVVVSYADGLTWNPGGSGHIEHLGFGFQGLLLSINLPPLASGKQMGYSQ